MFEKLKADSMAARKGKKLETKLLTTLLSEIKMRAKDDNNREVTDDDVVKVAQKFLKGAEETIAMLMKRDGNSPDALAVAKLEIKVLNTYLPTLMDETATKVAVNDAVSAVGASSMKDMGKVMAELKTVHGATIDMKIASAMYKVAI